MIYLQKLGNINVLRGIFLILFRIIEKIRILELCINKMII